MNPENYGWELRENSFQPVWFGGPSFPAEMNITDSAESEEEDDGTWSSDSEEE